MLYNYNTRALQVDKHIRRLDSDLSRFEQELQMKDLSGRRTSTASVSDLQTPTMSKSCEYTSSVLRPFLVNTHLLATEYVVL